jgi:hypothetical protein
MLSPSTDYLDEFDGQVRILCPPYRAARRFDEASTPLQLPLGAVLLGQSDNTLVALACLTASVHRWPWLVPCVAISPEQGPLEPLLFLVSELRDRLAVVKVRRPTIVAQPSDVLTAVRRRKRPDADTLATWVGYRLKNRELRNAVASQFRHVLGGPPASTFASAATFSRLFSRYGSLSARDWRAIALLCVHCARRSGESTVTLPIRTARDYLKKYLRLPYHALADRVGWEWVLEGALRAGGYVNDHR